MSDPRPTKKSRIVRSEPNPSSTPLSSTSSEAVNVSCTNNNARRMKLAHSVVLRLHKNKGARRQAQSAQKVSHASSSGHTEVEDSVVDTTAAAGGADDEGDASVTGPQASSSSDVPKRAAPRPCQDWLPFRKEYLDELHRHDALGRHDKPPKCSQCGEHEGVLRCVDCFAGGLQCAECIKKLHTRTVLHRLQRWNGTYFSDETLQNVGQHIQAGHEQDDFVCAHPVFKSTSFEVLDLTGQHTVTISFCGCPGAPHQRVQLLRLGWFPATTDRPNTAFTFDVLNTFQLLNLQAKLSAYDFYQSLLHKTDNMGTSRASDSHSSNSSVRDRYEQLLPVVRIWRHLKMLKRSGRGLDPLGIDSTTDGECAVECPACPQPGKNLPPNWKDAEEKIRWIYALILTIDANFKLSLKEKGIKDDPALGDAWAHWVPREEFYDYLREHGGAVEPCYCDSDLKAVNTAARNTKNYKASGMGACLCGRHGLLRKNGFGSLQIGERYPNIDFIVFCGLVRCIIGILWFSYDIVCQWSRNLVKRVATLPTRMQVKPEILNAAKKVLPKFHEYNHGYSCQTEYSLNITRYAGRTNGEEPERWWRYINPASMSTKEMGEGSREDTLDDFARAWNFRKIVNFGSFYVPKLDEAVEMEDTHRDAFQKFNERFPVELSERWQAEVAAWDSDHSQPNPYVEPTQGISIASLKLELAKEEAAEAARGVFRSQEKSSSAFLWNALDLEEEQRLLVMRTKSKATTLQASALEEKRNTLRRRIARFRDSQAMYMPGVAELCAEEDLAAVTPSAYDIIHYPTGRPSSQKSSLKDSESNQPEHDHIWLPSAIPVHMREKACPPALIATEARMQLALMDDLLAQLCRQLRIAATVRDHKRSNGGGTSQRMGTRTQHVLDRFAEKIDRYAARYRAAYAALASLDPEGIWKQRLRVLKPDDVRSPHRIQDEDLPSKKRKSRQKNDRSRPSEGRRELSWIWLRKSPLGRPTMENMESDLDSDEMRAEWARTSARADRWSEEVIWLVEEMRRILQYFQWKAEWWRKRAERRTDASPEVLRGLRAYAYKQAALITALGHSFAKKWHPAHVEHNIDVEWPPEFIPSP